MIDFTSLLPSASESDKLQATFEPVRNFVQKSEQFDDAESEWLWNGAPLESLPDGHSTFVYLITNKITHKRYIGFKIFTSKRTKVVKGKKVRVLTESDWKDYWSSSDNLNNDVKKYGPGNFIREIVCFTVNKSVGKYIEAQLQFEREVLTKNKDLYYNGIVNLRINQHTLSLIDRVVWCTEKLLGDQLAEQQ